MILKQYNRTKVQTHRGRTPQAADTISRDNMAMAATT